MLLVRILGLLAAVTLGVLVLLYVVSGNRRYLNLAWVVFRYALFLVVLVLLLFLFERLLVAI
jgi:hypothetical protein